MGEERGLSHDFFSSSESVLKVTYGNVGGQQNFSPVAAFILATFLSPAFFPVRLESLIVYVCTTW